MTDISTGSSTAVQGNPVATPGARSVADAVPPQLVARLVSAVVTGSEPTLATSRCPFTGDVLAQIPESSPADVATAFVRARAAQRDWVKRPVRERAAVLLRFHDLILKHKDELLDLVQAETGKTRAHAFEEVLASAIEARHYGRAGAGYLKPRRRGGVFPVLTQVLELRQPKGVIGQISPWNYPLALFTGDAVPAFVAGNAVVTKPDSQTALTALRARELMVEAGLPAELWQIVIGDGPVVGPEVVAHADYVSFTGSTRTGRDVAQRAAARLIGASMELGGKNAMLVLADADLEKAAEGAVRACFSSAGQLCISIERLYVASSIADAFLEKFVARAKALKLGNSLSWGADMGSLVSQRQFDTVTRHVEDAVKNGATVLAGGKPRTDVGPLFFEPTILDGVTTESAVCTEETFGPVVSIYRFDDEEEAIAQANGTSYGLNSSVWSKNLRHAKSVAARLHSGTVNVNEGYAPAYASVAAPMGGMGDSGIGRRHGSEGILKYTEVQTVAVQRLIQMTPSFGLDDEGYAKLLGKSLGMLKALRFK
ncbi:succinic semialdehyde dehydrogenase [Streptacidiphilus jiangxiensis]|uniref:succinate-semialdehyde dehydrogenase (NADP(+)) n=1 Tax=Streptacidiphilus jiangxiensis TaxID=235985 RepID=A0A1H7M966_STRJI|nr:succinic semialdehyde dehydrogenase [Streptacidiphilus jiangxiensis]SEL07786.1 succinate-semialdehyde dehydrogenase / glutarate-semialdehyde dehydrogenase [Streptacidiphilus jiangxiensis]